MKKLHKVFFLSFIFSQINSFSMQLHQDSVNPFSRSFCHQETSSSEISRDSYSTENRRPESPYNQVGYRCTNTPHKKRVLVLCGGGVRGVMELRFLQKLTKEVSQETHQIFDLIAGTSFGGCLALSLSQKKFPSEGIEPYIQNIRCVGKSNHDKAGLSCCTSAPTEQTRRASINDECEVESNPTCSADFLFKFMRSNVHEIFKTKLSSLGGLRGPRYKSSELRKFFQIILGSSKIRDSLSKVMIITHDLRRNQPQIFKSYCQTNEEDFLNEDIAVATSAAPTYFKPATVFPIGKCINNHMGYHLIDGGVSANNPAVCALVEAFKLFPNCQIEMLVLGTGKLQNPQRADELEHMGFLGWGKSLIHTVIDSQSHKDSYCARKMLSDNAHIFSEWNPVIPSENSYMDNTDPRNIDDLITFMDALISSRRETFDALVKRLKGKH